MTSNRVPAALRAVRCLARATHNAYHGVPSTPTEKMAAEEIKRSTRDPHEVRKVLIQTEYGIKRIAFYIRQKNYPVALDFADFICVLGIGTISHTTLHARLSELVSALYNEVHGDKPAV